MQIVQRPNGDANALHNPNTDTVSVNVSDVSGDCVAEITWTANVVAHGTPLYERYHYNMTEHAGQVRGSGTVEGLGDAGDGDPTTAAAKCSQPFVVTGTVRRTVRR